MAKLNDRFIALEKLTDTQCELPMSVNDMLEEEEIKGLQRNGRMVYRTSATSLTEEFI